MPRFSGNTTVGSGDGEFLTTQWSQILHAGTADGERQRLLLDNLARRYWKPVYCYIRRKGHSNDCAKDLTQGFFCDVVLNSSLVKRADQGRGRFRQFLLTAIECYLADQHRKKTAKRRLPLGGLASLDVDGMPDLPATVGDLEPSAAFNYGWATQVLDETLSQVRQQCARAHKEVHWRLFQEKVVRPIMEGTPGPSFADLCSLFGIRDEHTASNMIITVKRCFRRVLDDLLTRQAGRDSALEDEYHDLLHYLGKGGAE
jgi:DNA-directed RNA polymerase specialized sigma24 family protein